MPAGVGVFAARPHRLEAQDAAFSRRKPGFESLWGQHAVDVAFHALGLRSRACGARDDGFATVEEIRAAALQFVRKVSGYRQPSRANEPGRLPVAADLADELQRGGPDLLDGGEAIVTRAAGARSEAQGMKRHINGMLTPQGFEPRFPP